MDGICFGDVAWLQGLHGLQGRHDGFRFERGQRTWHEIELAKHLVSAKRPDSITSASLRLRTRDSYNRIATQFSDTWYQHVPAEPLELLVRALPRNSSVLDVGCGPGHHAAYLKKRGLDPTGIDFSPAMLAIAKANNPSIPFAEKDVVVDRLPRAGFDAVWSAIALNHVPEEDIPTALANLVGTLRPNGVLGINVQVGRESEQIEFGSDQRFFEYPKDERSVHEMVRALRLEVVSTNIGTTTRNIHGSSRPMKFVTVIARKTPALSRANQ